MEDNNTEIKNNIQMVNNENENENNSQLPTENKLPKQWKTEDEIKEYCRTHKKSRKYMETRNRAITNFINGVEDPEYKVSVGSNGDYRLSKRKVPLQTTINVNQIPENKPTKVIEEKENQNIPQLQTSTKPKTKNNIEHNPFNDIVFYNMSNQVNEQLNKRLDSITQEIQRLRNKNTKLKGKYKSLKQAIFVTDSDDEVEENIPQQQETQQQQEIIEENIPQQHYEIYQQPIRRTNGINFNKFFD